MKKPRAEAASKRAGLKPKDHDAQPTPSVQPVKAAKRAQRDQILGYLNGLHASHLLAFGQQTGAFQQLANAEPHGLNADELADRTGWFLAYTRQFLEACYALGVLDLASEAGVTERTRYRFAPHMAQLLTDEHDPYYLGEFPRLHVLTSQDYARLPQLYREGKSFPFALHGEAFLRSSATATRALPQEWMRDVLPRLPELHKRLQAGAHVLDVGCGAGWGVVALAEAFPKCRVLGVDAEPNAIEMAKTLIVFRQLGSRADARLVRSEALEYEAEFDVATLFVVLHTIPEKNKAAALAHIQAALKRDGLLVILDEAYPEAPQEFRRPERQGTVVAQWTEGPWGHRYDRRGEVADLMEKTGFEMVEELDAGHHVVYVARKAAA